MTKRRIVIYGTGAFAEVAAEYFSQDPGSTLLAFVDDAKSFEHFLEIPVLDYAGLRKLGPHQDFEVFIAIGYSEMNNMRKRVFERLNSDGFKFATYVHPSVQLWKSNSIGSNVFIFENNVIQPHVQIGDNTVLWSGNHIGHHTKIGPHCFISSHVVVSGSCVIEEGSFLGVNATVHDSVRVGKKALVGAGAVVSSDLAEESVIVPPRSVVLKRRSSEIGF